MLLKKKLEDYETFEVEQVFSYLKKHLKHSGETLTLENEKGGLHGYKIKYLEYHIVRETEDHLYGFEDELVFVGTLIKGDGTEEETYMGMHERGLTVEEKRAFLGNLTDKQLEEIILGQLANKALYEYNTRKDRGDRNGNC